MLFLQHFTSSVLEHLRNDQTLELSKWTPNLYFGLMKHFSSSSSNLTPKHDIFCLYTQIMCFIGHVYVSYQSWNILKEKRGDRWFSGFYSKLLWYCGVPTMNAWQQKGSDPISYTHWKACTQRRENETRGGFIYVVSPVSFTSPGK